MKKLFLIFFLLFCCSLVSAAHPTLLSVHGHLMNKTTGAGVGGIAILLSVCTDSACTSVVYGPDSVTTENTGQAIGNFDLLLENLSGEDLMLNYNQDYWLKVSAGGEEMGIFKFRGGQGQIAPEDIDSNANYAFGSTSGNITAGGVYVGSSNEIRSASGPLYVNSSGGSGLYVMGGAVGTYGQLRAGTILSTGTTGSTPFSGAGTRFMWVPAKGAIRAGAVDSIQWNDSSIGTYSVAMGKDTKALGNISTAFGSDSTAAGAFSTAMGRYTTADGQASTAMGYYSTASGAYSTAMGYYTTASADYSTVIGSGQDASNPLVNNVPNSLMVGFGSTTPTLFVGSTFVGIGTTNPQSTLDVQGDISAGGLLYLKHYTSANRPSCAAGKYGALIWYEGCIGACGCVQVCAESDWENVWDPGVCSK